MTRKTWEELAAETEPDPASRAEEAEYAELSRVYASAVLAGKSPPQELVRRLLLAAREAGKGVKKA